MIEFSIDGIAADVGEWDAAGPGRWMLRVNAGMFLYADEERPDEDEFSATLEFNGKVWSVELENTSRGNSDGDRTLDTADRVVAQEQAEKLLLAYMREWRETSIEAGGEVYE